MKGADAEAIERLDYLRPLVALVGRPNVGKSTLFNRLLGRRLSITDQAPGATRDRVHAPVEWGGRRFALMDTGGYVPRSRDAVEAAVCAQAEMAIREADLVVLVCEADTGPTDLDREVAQLLKRQKPEASLVVVNKVDNPEKAAALDEFYALGLGQPLAVSASTGQRSGDLLEALVGRFPPVEGVSVPEEEPAICAVLAGRPNVGKSTLINRLAGYQVSVVHDQPGTTRDTTSTRLRWRGNEFIFMDTAGLRRRSKVEAPIEFYSGRRAALSIARADVAVVLLDAAEGAVTQDGRIMAQVLEQGCGLVLAVNKWDRAGQGTTRQWREDLYHRFPFVVDYPLLFVSALKGSNLGACLAAVARVGANRQRRIPTARLNKMVQRLDGEYTPAGQDRSFRLLYATQHGVKPPSFTVFANFPELLSDSYTRFLEKRLRQEGDFEGTPLRIVWRQRSRRR
jgi:GTP-binding protein